MPKTEKLYRTPAEWTESNPILGAGQVGKERFTNKIKVGDGGTRWNDLTYAVGESALSGGGGGEILFADEPTTAYWVHEGNSNFGYFETASITETSWLTSAQFTDNNGEPNDGGLFFVKAGLYRLRYEISYQQPENVDVETVTTFTLLDQMIGNIDRQRGVVPANEQYFNVPPYGQTGPEKIVAIKANTLIVPSAQVSTGNLDPIRFQVSIQIFPMLREA